MHRARHRPLPARRQLAGGGGHGERARGRRGAGEHGSGRPARAGGSDEYSEGEGRRGSRALNAAPCSPSRMTRGGGRGSSRGRGSRELGATRGGWAPLAPPREAPACLRPRPLRARRARLRRVAAAAAAAAMSPGKPGAGGAGTRRTRWRRRRRRRRLEAETRAPGFGHTAGRVPGTFQGAQGMKPAARETRTPPRSPGLRWTLLPLLLLLRQGQVSLRVGLGVWWEDAGRSGIACTCPCVTRSRNTRRGSERSRSWEPSSWRELAGSPAPATDSLPWLPGARGRAGFRGPQGVPRRVR